jgi:single-strand DNA-binding protein
MSKGVNKAILLGHVGKDPEIRSTNGGTIVASLSLATADRQKDGQGNWQDRTEWHNLVAFNRTAEIIRDYVRKGSQLLIEGKIQTRTWDDRESGQKKYRTEILIYELTLLGGRPEDEGRASNGRSHSAEYGRSSGATVNVASEREAWALVMRNLRMVRTTRIRASRRTIFPFNGLSRRRLRRSSGRHFYLRR